MRKDLNTLEARSKEQYFGEMRKYLVSRRATMREVVEMLKKREENEDTAPLLP